MFRRLSAVLALVAIATVIAGGCSSDSEGSEGATGDAASCETEDLALFAEGDLTVATGEPAFEPWMVDDDPTNGDGYESAVVYAVAGELGFEDDDVNWVRTGFDEAVAPGDKEYDFNVQQYSITDERGEVVDLSVGYYDVEQALVAAADGPLAGVTSIEELKTAKLGAAIGTTSLDYIENVIQPDTPPLVFDDNAAAKAAFDANQVEGLVFDLPTAYYIVSAEIPDASIVGVLPQEGDSEQLGFLLAKGSELTPCVNEAIATLESDGTLAKLQEEWLDQGGTIPTLTN